MARQITKLSKKEQADLNEAEERKRLLGEFYSEDAEKELNKPITKFEFMLVMEQMLADVSLVYALIDYLDEKKIISATELMKRYAEENERNGV